MQVSFRASDLGVMGHQINPLWWTRWAISCSSQCSMIGVTKAVICTLLPVGWHIYNNPC